MINYVPHLGDGGIFFFAEGFHARPGSTLSGAREALRSRRRPRPRIRPRGVMEYWSTAPIWNCTPRPRGWRCFQGDLGVLPQPGLKPGAILLDHFMVKNWHRLLVKFIGSPPPKCREVVRILS